jgi:hypothetical protein
VIIEPASLKTDYMTPIFFADQAHFRIWLEENHKEEAELLVGFIKRTAENIT